MSSGEADAAQTYDFKNAKRGVFFERAKIGIKTYEVDDIIARLESMTDDPAILARELRRLGIDYPGDADREDD